jgi:DNA replication protein DnaC
MTEKIPEILSFCPVCKEPNTEKHGKYEVHVDCKCERESRIDAKIRHLQNFSMLGKRYEKVTFDGTNTGINAEFDRAFNRAQKFCENHGEIIKKGLGMYIFGDIGTGKTHLTACIANELLKNCVFVLFTSLFEISKAVRSSWGKNAAKSEQDLIDKFSEVDVLFFDDLGTEKLTKNQEDSWLQCLLFDLVNRRYNARKTTIFSSNYSINELVAKRGLAKHTASRIAEMSAGAIMKISGESMRGKFQEKLPF